MPQIFVSEKRSVCTSIFLIYWSAFWYSEHTRIYWYLETTWLNQPGTFKKASFVKGPNPRRRTFGVISVFSKQCQGLEQYRKSQSNSQSNLFLYFVFLKCSTNFFLFIFSINFSCLDPTTSEYRKSEGTTYYLQLGHLFKEGIYLIFSY